MSFHEGEISLKKGEIPVRPVIRAGLVPRDDIVPRNDIVPQDNFLKKKFI
jgi:hypothetical protein